MNKIIEEIKEHKKLIIILLIFIIIVIISAVGYINDKNKVVIPNYEIEDTQYIITNFKDNEYRVITVSDIDMINIYYKEFINKMIHNQKEAWDLLEDNCRNLKFNNDFNYFKKYINNLITVKTENSTIEKYKVDNSGPYVLYSVITSEKIKISFYEYGVFKYRVYIEGKI